MRYLAYITAVLVLAAAAAAGCDGCGEPPESPGELVESDRPRAEPTAVDRDAREAHHRAGREVTFELFEKKRSADPTANFAMSPWALRGLMARVYAASGGDTRDEIAEALGFELDESQLHSAFHQLDREWERRARAGSFTFWHDGALIVDADTPIDGDYLDRLAAHYGAGVHLVDFAHNPDASLEAIDRWVDARLPRSIDGRFAETGLDVAQPVVAANTVYFRAPWQYRFDRSATEPALFDGLDGGSEDVEMMHGEAMYRFYDRRDTTAVAIRYADANVSLIAAMPSDPKADFDDWAGAFDRERFDAVVDGLSRIGDGEVYLPRFEIAEPVDAGGLLEAMGVESAYGADRADFSGLSGDRSAPGALVGPVQAVFFRVDEQGHHGDVEVVDHPGRRDSGADEPVRFDRPFLFFAYDDGTSAILLAGQFVKSSRQSSVVSR